MPAPNSRLKPQSKAYAPVDVAIKIYKKTVAICLKMPKRYTYLMLQDIIHLAGEVMDNCKKANSIFPTDREEANERKICWVRARASAQALSTRLDRLLEVPGITRYPDDNGKYHGITEKELTELADLVNQELGYISNLLPCERERFKDLK